MKIIVAAALAACVAGCASSAANISATYVSPLQYQNLTCQQLGEEAARISARVTEKAGVQDSNRTKDAVVTTAAIVIFWPIAFALSGDGPNAAELGRLKGEMEAIEKAAIAKKCNINFQRG